MRPDIRRLRATWIVGLTNRYVPDAFTCHAARIKTLKRFEPYRPDLGDKDLVAVGGGCFTETDVAKGCGQSRLPLDFLAPPLQPI